MQKQLTEEKLLFAKVLDAAKNSQMHSKITTTDFLDMAKSCLFMQKLNTEHLQCMAFGGNEQCERRMIAFAPDFLDLTENDFPIKALRITKNKKFGQTNLSHRDYLGAILALGIDRAKVGDIIVLEQQTICYISQDLAEYVSNTLEYVSRTKVNVSVSDIFEVSLPPKVWHYQTITAASLRLDVIAGGVFPLSRAKVQEYIKKEMVQVNWNTIISPSFLLKEEDMVSMRGFGRFKLFEIGRITKKNKICVTIGRE